MKLLIVDVETTAIHPNEGYIVEIGAVLLDNKTFDIQAMISSIIKADNPDSEAWIFWNSNLRVEDVQNGVDLEGIREKLQSLLNKYITVAYCSEFDFGWLESKGFKIPKKGKDPMVICREMFKIPRNAWSYKNPSVQECLNYFKIDEHEPHRALVDATLEAKILTELIKMGQYEILESLAMADTPEKEIIRYQSKIESYDHMIKQIQEKREFCSKKIAELEKAEPTQV